MTAVVVCDAPQRSDEWLAARRGGITGTDIGALLGLNPWRTALDVWMSKVDDAEPTDVGEPAQWGQRLEPVVRDHYAAQHGVIVDEAPGLLGHKAEPRLLGSLDGLAHSKDGTVVLEIKTTRQSWADGYLPDAYLTQALWYLGITGLDTCHVAILTAGQSYSERVVTEDTAWFDDAADYALDWWDRHVEARVMPDPDPVRDAPKLPRLWTPDPGRSVELDPDLVAALRDAKARAAAAKTDLERAVAAVQLAMTDATTGTVAGEAAVTWAAVKGRTTIDTGLLREAFPEVAKQVIKQGEPSRRFTVKHG